MKPTVLTVTFNPSLDKTIVLDELRIGSLNRARQVRLDPGGKGINVAKLLHDFQLPVVAAGLYGGDEGNELAKLLRTTGLTVDFLQVAGRTRTNLKIVDASAKTTTEINEPGAEISPRDLQAVMDRIRDNLKGATHLVLAGSLPPGVPASVYAELIRAAKNSNIITVLDADGDALKQGVSAGPYALKPNIHELEQWSGKSLKSDEEIVAAGREMIANGVSLILVSMGEKGSIAINETETFRVRPFPITIKSSVGAGDSMVAALIYCMLNGKSLKETAAITSAAGTLTASKEGTQVCSLSEVLEHVHLVSVQPISNNK
ncbi:1-phosphofructokinase [Ferviditalea candida]|uniref:Tagatose-6-phosphate kinase n=1 Tax=Ferviditalea candida TaxID=3108399 RepID=A0ABU5ZGW4_9BACL|nr:1-phosphofructokinase [Paenibacillaceae bacterium T2]